MTNQLLFHKIFPADVITHISDRSVDFVLETGQTDLTREQKEYLSSRLPLPLKKIFNIHQVHGNHVLSITEKDIDHNENPTDGDAVVTNTPRLPLTVRTADCLPVFLCDSKRKCIGLAHAGWRGSEKSVVVHTIKMMNTTWGCLPQDILVAFGPAIRVCCYQVGSELQNIFPQETVSRDENLYLDLALVNKNQLIRQGIKDANIFDCQQCTCCDARFFSYRREGGRAGRHLSLMMLEAKV